MAEDDDYHSSDDDDYVPEDTVDDADDEPSGDECDEVQAGDNVIINKKRGEKSSLSGASTSKGLSQADEDDVEAAFLAMIAESDSQFSAKPTEKKPVVATTPSTVSAENTTDAAGFSDDSKMTKITEVFDFAGDEIKIEREVTVAEMKEREKKDAKVAQAVKKQPQKRVGLGDALNLLSKKPKMSLLDKSSLDWKSFKQDSKLEKELETYNKGKNGYLNKVDFLTKIDHQQFEKEKNMRNAARKQ